MGTTPPITPPIENNMKSVNFIKGQGGLAKTLPGEDHYCGMCFYYDTLPTGFGELPVKQILSLPDAESNDILSTGDFAILHYHIKEFFRVNKNGVLFVGIFDVPSTTYDFAEINTIQDYSLGKIRQMFVYQNSVAFATSQVTAIQARIEAANGEYKPLEVFYTGDFHAVTNWTTAGDLRALTAPNVSVIIGQDGGNEGAALYTSETVTIGGGGAFLGTISKALVSENPGWIEKFQMDETELEIPALANGDLVKDNKDVLAGLDSKGYIFLYQEIGISGTYWNDSHTCVAVTNDFAQIEINRTINKAIRGIRTKLLPKLKATVKVDKATGKLQPAVCKYYESLADKPLEEMEAADELSGGKAYVDVDQNVNSTSKLKVVAKLVPMGINREIEVTIGMSLKLT